VSNDCLFCRIVAEEIPATVVHDTPTLLAFRDIAPKAPVHALVITKEHHPDVATLTANHPVLAADLLAGTAAVAGELGVAESGYRVIFNVGPDSGQEVPHVHAHVLGGTRLGGGLAT
jgi:histidine triad (HIT) family protein